MLALATADIYEAVLGIICVKLTAVKVSAAPPVVPIKTLVTIV